MDRFTALRVLVTVAEERGFAAAARKLGLSTSAVSRHVADLEGRLGVPLLRRTTRRIDLTEAGVRFLPRAAGLLTDLDALESEVSDLASRPRGLLRITSAPQFGEQFVSPVAAAFARAYPDVRVELDLSERVVDLVGEGVDLAVRAGRLAASSLRRRSLAEPRYIICASPEYLRRNPPPETPADLRRHDCVIGHVGGAYPTWNFVDPDGRVASMPIRGRFAAASAHAQREAMLAGVGIAMFLPALIEEDLQSGRAVQLLTDYRLDRNTISLVWPPADPTPPKLRVFIDFLVGALHKSGGFAPPATDPT